MQHRERFGVGRWGYRWHEITQTFDMSQNRQYARKMPDFDRSIALFQLAVRGQADSREAGQMLLGKISAEPIIPNALTQGAKGLGITIS